MTDEPLNKSCEDLGIKCFNLFVDKNVIRNLNLNFEKNKLYVKNYFDSGIASSLAFLSEQEKKDGVLLTGNLFFNHGNYTETFLKY